ncbi:MAG: antitoxin VbhA family protein [Acidobacteria bacterium]|nr:antitoxin VbhA family protein [Acidobacteriota bacterium]
MIIGQSTITDQERETRLEAIAQSAASNRLEGLESSAEAKEIFARFAAGELTLEEMGLEIESLNERKFGPLSLPRD